MDTVREQWTDERLDDLKGEVATLRTEMRDEFRAVRKEIGSLRTEMTSEFVSIRNEVHAGFASLHRTMIQFGGIVIVAIIGLIGSQLWIASQL
jgi:phage host-nuclease inhibitor protein Gam